MIRFWVKNKRREPSVWRSISSKACAALESIFKQTGDPIAILKDKGSDLAKGVSLWKDNVKALGDAGDPAPIREALKRPSKGEKALTSDERAYLEESLEAIATRGGALPEEVSNATVRREVTVRKTATGETHEIKLLEDGVVIRCTDFCMEISRNLRERSVFVRKSFPPEAEIRTKASQLTDEAKAIKVEAKKLAEKAKAEKTLPEAERLKSQAKREASEADLVKRAEKLERQMAELESAATKELETTSQMAVKRVKKLLDEHPQLRGEFGDELRKLKTHRSDAIDLLHDAETRQLVVEELSKLKLRLNPAIEKPLTYGEVISRDFEGTAIGFYQQSTIISDFFLSQCSIITFPHLSSLDQSLMSLSADGDILSFYLQGNIGHYGWAYYRDGKKIRVHQNLEGEVVIDEGEPLPEEDNDEHPSTNIFNLSKRLLGARVDHLIFDSDISFTAYQEADNSLQSISCSQVRSPIL